MKPTLTYAWLTVKHRWYVLLAGLRIGAPIWLLLTHDLSKFGFAELRQYGRQFYGDKSDPIGFAYTWLHHQRVNKHHWEYWVPASGHARGGFADMEPLPMLIPYALEMVADFMGASRAYEGVWPDASWPFMRKNFAGMMLHPTTREFVARIIKAQTGCDLTAKGENDGE